MLKTMQITVNVLTCDKCGFEWQKPVEKELPKVCGKCKSARWNKGVKDSVIKRYLDVSDKFWRGLSDRARADMRAEYFKQNGGRTK